MFHTGTRVDLVSGPLIPSETSSSFLNRFQRTTMTSDVLISYFRCLSQATYSVVSHSTQQFNDAYKDILMERYTPNQPRSHPKTGKFYS